MAETLQFEFSNGVSLEGRGVSEMRWGGGRGRSCGQKRLAKTGFSGIF